MEKPLHIYDMECGFCRRWIAHWRSITDDSVNYAPYQEVAFHYPDIPESQFKEAVHLIESDGTVYKGAEAVLRTLAHAPNRRWMLQAYRYVPGVRGILNLGYRFIAKNRSAFSVITQWLWGDHVGQATYQLTRWIFLRGLGFVYLAAFVSLWSQIHGLIGHDGILPMQELLQAAQRQFGADAAHILPTLFWINPSDAALTWVCVAGVVLSIFLIAGFAQLVSLIGLWVCYLSLTVVGQEFLSFQWDILLLEAGFLSIFFAPFHILPKRPHREGTPSAVVLLLMRWLLFRLMFGSGFVKLASGDPAWKNLTALTHHYETQPLPNVVSWHFHQMPVEFHVFCATFMFIIELAIPFLIFAPRRIRMWGSGAMIFFQILILSTGNYAFFNILTILLCLLLLDDGTWPQWIHRLLVREGVPKINWKPWRWPAWITLPIAALVLFLSTTPSLLVRSIDESGVLIEAHRWLSPFRLVNSFGLFAVMTTSRPEIIIEGSQDGEKWLAYEFKYKPGNLKRKPAWVAPHQPRLDWQMWFAALNSYRGNPWFVRFCQRLLEGSPETLKLLKKNPFPDRPPRYIRATLYDYRFTNHPERAKNNTWWYRDKIKPYCPTLSLERDS